MGTTKSDAFAFSTVKDIAIAALWCLAASALVALCSCATSYRESNGGTGYGSTRTATNEFNISFQGNADTTVERAYDFALLRSAEVTREHGFHFFSVLDVTNTSSARRYTSVYIRYGTPVIGGQDYGRYYYIAAPSMVQVQQPGIYYKPGVVLHIQCFPEKPERSFAYDAEPLQQTLRRKYKIH